MSTELWRLVPFWTMKLQVGYRILKQNFTQWSGNSCVNSYLEVANIGVSNFHATLGPMLKPTPVHLPEIPLVLDIPSLLR